MFKQVHYRYNATVECRAVTLNLSTNKCERIISCEDGCDPTGQLRSDRSPSRCSNGAVDVECHVAFGEEVVLFVLSGAAVVCREEAVERGVRGNDGV